MISQKLTVEIPKVTQTFPLARGGEAIDALGQRKAVGKVVVQVR